MASVIKRKVRESWRDALVRRLACGTPGSVARGLASFDAQVRDGAGEAEAVYLILEDEGLLWEVNAPGFTSEARPKADRRHQVPPA